MGSMALDHFEKLVAGSARGTLGDGEAATIAIALEIDGIPLLDDHKACGICDKRYPKLSYGCSIDIFAHAEVGRALGTSGLALAVFNALMKARMRVLPQHERWVVNLIGPERAAQCGSLSRSARSSFDIP
ncbi:MAG: hypothetical protein MPK62_09375 [Alphaproteobacteria bacterium]|nr:hypothetical protein [Alphaproteobacteria bacterium]